MKNVDPYRVFFPIGLLNAFLAVGVWFLRDLPWLSAPALFIHGKLIAGGFLWAFITGFLMTAVPKMTGASPASRIEFLIPLGAMAAMLATAWGIDPRPFYFSHLLLVLFLISFVARRHITSNRPAPIFFSHIGLALLLAAAGDVYHAQGYSSMGVMLLQVGAVLLLVLGIGTRFFSFLTGIPSIFESTTQKLPRYAFHTCGVLVAGSLWLAGEGYLWAYAVLSILALVYLFVFWKVQRKSERHTALRYAMTTVATMIPMSFALSWLLPQQFLTWLHLLFIGCFGLITFSVATRVTLSHGAFPVDIEMKSKALWWVVGCIVLAALTRLGYGITTDAWWQKSWMHTAAGFWVAAATIWTVVFLKKILYLNKVQPTFLAKPPAKQ